MSENKTEFSEKLNNDRPTQDNPEMNDTPSENSEDELVVKTASMFEQEEIVVGEQVKPTETINISDIIDQNEIEADAKEYYNNNHATSIEDKIKSLQEKARNTFAAEEMEVDEQINACDTYSEKTDTSDDDIKVVEDSSCDKTKDYDMSQLIKILGGTAVSQDDDEEEEQRPKKKKAKKLDFTDENDAVIPEADATDDVNEYSHSFEYTDRIQSSDMFKSFRKSAVVATVSMILTLITTIFCVWIELGNAAGLPFSYLMHPGRYGRIFSMVCLQMLAFAVFFNLDGLHRGIKKLSFKHPAPEASTVVLVVVTALHTLYTCIFEYQNTNYRTFCFAGCISLLLLSINTFIKAYTRFKSFAMVIAKKPKFATLKLNALSAESGTFAKYLGEESEVLTVCKTDSVEDFVKTEYTVPSVSKANNIVLYTVLIISIITSLVSAVFLEVPLYSSLTRGMSVLALSLPVSMLFVTALPYFISFSRLEKLRTSIFGEAACDNYENTGVVSFDDTEVFPPKAVKVTSIKTYNEHPIDKVIINMAKAFHKLGGPLSYVFSSSIQGEDGEPAEDEVMLLENSSDGLHLKIADDDILIGKGSYLRMYDIEAPVDAIDESEMRSLTSILYLVCNNSLAAKIYIRYSINPRFEKLLKSYYDAGICCGVKTFDPGVDNQLIYANLKGTNYPISVIKKDVKELGRIEEKVSCSIVSMSTLHNFLKSFIILDKLRGTYKTNTVFCVLGCIIGLAFSLGMIFAFDTIVAPVTIILYQLLFIIPQLLVSIFNK